MKLKLHLTTEDIDDDFKESYSVDNLYPCVFKPEIQEVWSKVNEVWFSYFEQSDTVGTSYQLIKLK